MAPAKDDKSYFTPDKESAEEVYNRVTPQKIIPIEKMPYNTAYVTMVKNGNLVIPHKNHYHNIVLGLMIQKPSKHQVVIAWKNFATIQVLS